MRGVPERIERLRLAGLDRRYRAKQARYMHSDGFRRWLRAGTIRNRQARRVTGLRPFWWLTPYEAS